MSNKMKAVIEGQLTGIEKCTDTAKRRYLKRMLNNTRRSNREGRV